MNRRIVLGILIVILLVAGAVSLGVFAYNLGLNQNLVQSAASGTVQPGTGVIPYPAYGPFWFRPFGFGLFGCFGPFLFFFLIFLLFRFLFWGGRWGHGPGWRHEHWDRGVPPMFDEWHKKAHEQEGQNPPPQQ